MTGDEMERAIEFLLKSQANFETRFDETNRRWDKRLEESALQAEASKKRFEAQEEASKKRFEAHEEASKKRFEAEEEASKKRFEERTKEIDRQIAHTNMVVEALAETQNEFSETVLGFINSQSTLNASFQKQIDALTRAQQLTEQEILNLTRTVNNFINFSSGNGRSPRE